MKRLFIVFVFITLNLVALRAQGFVETEHVSASDLNDTEGNNHGSGSLFRVKGRCTMPLSKRLTGKLQPTAWSLTIAASYARMDNKGEAQTLNPDDVLNASVNVAHTRPLSERWQLSASLGAGVYSASDELAWRSVLANGVVIFAYRFSDNLSAGFGAGLTNSYGAPMVMPMGYLVWQTNGRVKVSVNMANSVSAKVSTMFSRTVGMELTAIEIDGMSAVRQTDGHSKIYSSMMMRSVLSPTFSLTKKAKLRLGLGGTWLRSARTTDRSLKGFFNNFGDDKEKLRFRPSLRLNVGLSYGL